VVPKFVLLNLCFDLGFSDRNRVGFSLMIRGGEVFPALIFPVLHVFLCCES